MSFIKGLSDEELAKVVSDIEQRYSLYEAIKRICGKYAHVKTSSEEYSKRKQEEKNLDL